MNSRPTSRTGPWGHILVSASACVLTVSIVGSAVFLTQRLYRRHELQGKIRDFVSSLDNRSNEELQERAIQLKDRPRLAEQLLPELARTLRYAQSEQQLCAAITLSKAFTNHRRILSALHDLRNDRREIVAAAAVRVMAMAQPESKAGELLGKCLEDAPAGVLSPAALDETCAGLYQLGSLGLSIARQHISSLTVERRVWLVGFVNELGGPHRIAWLEMLQDDADPRVRTTARTALTSPGGMPMTTSAMR